MKCVAAMIKTQVILMWQWLIISGLPNQNAQMGTRIFCRLNAIFLFHREKVIVTFEPLDLHCNMEESPLSIGITLVCGVALQKVTRYRCLPLAPKYHWFLGGCNGLR
jgi:hypothetical protein